MKNLTWLLGYVKIIVVPHVQNAYYYFFAKSARILTHFILLNAFYIFHYITGQLGFT